jgi:DNA modification methylase
LNIINKDINDLIPYVNNPRKNDKAVDAVASSIKNFGFKVPIIIDAQNEIVAGHTRLKAAIKLNYKEVPCIVADDLTPAQIKAYRIADNKVSELAEWDMDLLKIELEGLTDFTGFDINDSIFNNEVVEDDFEPEIPENPIVQKGDIWILGSHKLMCGNSTNLDDVTKLMDDKKARLIVTDPPYNLDYVGKTKDALTIQNDKMNDEQFYEFLLAAYYRMYEVADDGASIYVFHADSEGLNFRKAHKESGFKLSQCCIWAKQTMVMGSQDYHWQHEPILVGWKPTAGHYWNSDRKQTTIWRFDRPFRSEYHPTMKPIALISYPIKNSSKIGDIVLDLFGGSGSTLIACEQIDRICYMMELDERYCDVIIKRWESLTGQKALKLESL